MEDIIDNIELSLIKIKSQIDNLEKYKIQVSKPDIIFFDWDGTLINSVQSHLDIANRAIIKYGPENEKAWTKEKFTRESTFHNKPNLKKYFGDNFPHVDQMFNDEINDLCNSGQPLFDNSESILQFCKAKNIDTYLISSHPEELLMKEVSKLNFKKYFKNIIGGREDKPYKPDADPIYRALGYPESLEKDRMWFVGDSYTDMQCARRFGCVAFKIGEQERDDVITINHIDEFYTYLRFVMQDFSKK